MNQEGNVQQQEASTQEDVVRPGDFVYLTPEAIRRAPRLMGPIKMYSIGWPNEFQVLKVGEEDGVTVYAIAGCCRNLLLSRKNQTWLCGAHDAKWFRKLKVEEPKPAEAEKKTEAPPPPPRERKPGDRVTSVELPIVGEVAAMEFLDDEQNPQFIVRSGRQRVALNGRIAVEIAKVVKANGWL